MASAAGQVTKVRSRRRHGAHRRRAPAIRAAVGVTGVREGGEEEEAPSQGGLRRGRRRVRGGGAPQVLRGCPAEEGGGGGGEGPGQAPGHGARRGRRGQGEGPLGEPSVSSPSLPRLLLLYSIWEMDEESALWWCLLQLIGSCGRIRVRFEDNHDDGISNTVDLLSEW